MNQIREMAGLEAVSREPLSMYVARRIRDAIMAGELPDGAALPSEKELCTRLGVGRSTVREALRILQAQGLVTGGDTVSTRGPVVSGPGAVTGAAFALENVLRLGQVPVDDLVTLRLLIEGEAVELAATRQDGEALGRAASAIVAMERAGPDAEAFLQADVAFHAALVEGAGNVAFTLVHNVLRGAMANHLRAGLEAESDAQAMKRALVGQHRRILNAVRRGDGAGAAKLLRRHIQSFYKRQAG